MSLQIRALIFILLLMSLRCREDQPSDRFSRSVNNVNTSTDVLGTTVCKIAAEPSTFYEKHVRVTGCISTDGIERTVLSDRSCPYVGVAVTESEKLQLHQRVYPVVGKEICGTFSGVFKEHTMINHVIVYSNVLELEKTANISVVNSTQ